MRCMQCKHFVKTYEGEGWCSNPKYSGLVILSTCSEPCRGNGYVKGIEQSPVGPVASEETPRTP
jgi:hypothetical protein